jgi:hypothetical protein
MSVPPVAARLLMAQAERSISSDERGPVGVALVLGGAVALVPAIVVAAGVTVLVGITIYLSKEVLQASQWSKYKSCSKQYDRDRAKCREVKSAKCWASAAERLAYCNKTQGETGFPPLEDD